ncbi:periplasmic binding protein-like I [Obelidium mucronatum]|nr:periplasmic binding protein-like I [Obelidium mucronatum]
MAVSLLALVLCLGQLCFAQKNQSSITIAFVGPYSWYKGFTFNGSLVTGGDENLDIAALSDTSKLGAWLGFFWIQTAGLFGVSVVNSNEFILPNTTINVKRFDVLDKYGRYSGASVMKTAQDIAENHKDVIAVFGELFPERSKYSAEIYSSYKIPFCGPAQTTRELLNRAKNPYYFQTRSLSGMEKAATLLLKSWNVTRIAIISDSSINIESNDCYHVMKSALKNNIQVVAAFSYANINNVGEVAKTLASVNARYIYLCGSLGPTADIYYSLALKTTPTFVGSDFVWFSMNPPIPSSEEYAVKLWGPGYQKYSAGIIMISPYNQGTQPMVDLQAYFANSMASFQSSYTSTPFDYITMQTVGMPPGFDCIVTLAMGMTNLLASNPSFTPEQLSSRQLQDHLNWTLFQNTGYIGLQADPTMLTENGDLLSSFVFGRTMGTSGTSGFAVFGYTDHTLTHYVPIEVDFPIFYSNTSIPPPDGPIYETLTLLRESPSGKTLTAFFVVGFVFVLIFWFVLAFFRSKPCVRTASVTFLSTTSIGYALSYSTNLMYFGIPSVAQCKTRVWIEVTAFAIVIGSLILKNARICMIFASKTIIPKWMINDTLWLVGLVGIVGIQQILMASWNSLSQLTILSTTTATTIQYNCAPKNPIMGYITWGLNAVLYAALIGVTYMSRNLESAHSEFQLLLVVCLIIPLGSLVISSIDDSTSMRPALIVWLVTTIPLLMQLVPILLQLYVSSRSDTWMNRWKNGSFQIASKISAEKPSPKKAQSSSSISDLGGTAMMLKSVKTDHDTSGSSSLLSANPKRKTGTVGIGGVVGVKKVSGKMIVSHLVIVSVSNAIGFQSEWIAGSIAIHSFTTNKAGDKANYLLFIPKGIGKDSVEFQPMAFRPKPTAVFPQNNPMRLVLDTFQGRVYFDFTKEEAAAAFSSLL